MVVGWRTFCSYSIQASLSSLPHFPFTSSEERKQSLSLLLTTIILLIAKPPPPIYICVSSVINFIPEKQRLGESYYTCLLTWVSFLFLSVSKVKRMSTSILSIHVFLLRYKFYFTLLIPFRGLVDTLPKS